MADQLAPNVDLDTWLGVTVDGARASQALEVATGWVQDFLGQRLLSVANETVTLPISPEQPSVWLPERPVTAVGTVLTTDVYGVNTARTLHVDYVVIGAEIRWLRWLNWLNATVTATYSHGYASAPQAVRGVVLSAAARIKNNPGGASTQSIDDYSVTYAGLSGSASSLTDLEKSALNRYKPMVVG